MNNARKRQWIFVISFLMLVGHSYGQKTERNLDSLDWKFHRVGDSHWYNATVPGTVYTDLFASKLIPDPFYGDNEKKIQWVDTCDWEYETTFNITENELKQNHIEIDFKGLDTYAKVFVNDSLVITADNMFLEWNRDIKSHIHSGKNTLRVRFNSTLKHDIAEEKKLPYKLPGEERVFSRKAQYQYGWDFAPRFIGCGIWKGVKLKITHLPSFEKSDYVVWKLNDSIAKITVTWNTACSESSNYKLITKCTGEPDESLEVKPFDAPSHLPFNERPIHEEIEITIHNPKKWWCNGIGKPYLYNISLELYDSYDIKIDEKHYSIGLRTIELVQDSDKIGKFFYFKLNGVPVFMKGANYVPQDMFLPRVSKEKIDSIVDMAAAANMNMLRVWGGGVYADDEFYKECDRKGILVWQDCMFACGMYPFDINSSENSYMDVYRNTLRIMDNTSLALLCGNNEIQEGWYNWDWQKQYSYSSVDSTKIWNGYKEFYDTVVRVLINEARFEGFKINYIPTSPQIGWGHKEAMRFGDSHYWGVWWGMEPFEIYNKKVPRFMSEYGFQSLPDMETLNKITDTLSLTSLKLKNHQKHPTGFQTIDEYMKRDFKVPTDFADYVYTSQLLQAEGMQIAIEAHRRHKPDCMGTLYWQFNDCWPGITWSSIDFYGKPKALYYRAKELYDNILISVIKESGKYNIYIVSDSLKELKGKLQMELMDFNGKVLADKTTDVTVPANSSAIYATLDNDFLNRIDTANTLLECSFMGRKKLFYFTKPKNLNLPKAKVEVQLQEDNTLLLKTDKLAKNVYLQMQGATFSGNYFDMLPGEIKTVKWAGKKEGELTITTLGDVTFRNQ